MATTIVRKIGDPAVPLGLEMVEDGAGVSGQSPTVELRRLSDEMYFDWTTLMWSNAVGGDIEGALTETTYKPGLYLRMWDHATYDASTPGDYLAIYRNTGAGYEAEVSEIYTFVEYPVTIELVRQFLMNKSVLTKNTETDYTFKTYNDAGDTIIRTESITVAGNDETREPV